MTAKQYLKQARYLDLHIKSKIEQVKSLHDLATKATSTLSDMPGSPTRNTHSMQYAAARIEELENQLAAAVDDIWKFSVGNICRSCAHWKNGHCNRPEPKDCGGYSWWQWRGFADDSQHMRSIIGESDGQPQ